MIRVENLTKYYTTRLAVDDISFNIEKGEIVGFLGPNGAGKTTTMRILTGFMAPTRGDVWIADHNMLSDSLEARRRIGYLPETVPLYTDMTVRAFLEYMARLRGLEESKIWARINEVVDICHLEEYVDVIISKLSRGFKQRVGVAQAIVHEPDVLILDEPTVGIDPLQVVMTRQLIKELGKEHTILLSTHILPEVSMVCERVIIMDEGKIVAEDRIENLSSIVSSSKRIKVEVKGPANEISRRLRRIPNVIKVSYQDPYHFVEFPSGQELRGKVTEAIVQSNWELLSLESLEMSLEDIFLKLTTEEEAEK